MTTPVAPAAAPTPTPRPARAGRPGADDDFAAALDTATAAPDRSADQHPAHPAPEQPASPSENCRDESQAAPEGDVATGDTPVAGAAAAVPAAATVPAAAAAAAAVPAAGAGREGAAVAGPTVPAARVAVPGAAAAEAADGAASTAAPLATAPPTAPIAPTAPTAPTAGVGGVASSAAAGPVGAVAAELDAALAGTTKPAAAQPVSPQPEPQDLRPPVAPALADSASGAPPAVVTAPAAPSAPTTPTAPAAPTPAAAPALSGVPVPVHEQLAPRIVSLVSGGDGEHRITLRVDPDDFGPVRVVAEVRGGDVAVVLHAGTDQGRDALRACLTDLRRDLEASGLRGSLDLAGGSAGGGQHRPAAHRQQHTAWLGDGGSAPAGPAQPVAVRIAGSAGLDLLV